MDNIVDLLSNFGGKWKVGKNDELMYLDRDVDVVEDFDLDYLNFVHIPKDVRLSKYKQNFRIGARKHTEE